MDITKHIPVLAEECIEHLNVQANKRYVDATIGGAGHSTLIRKRGGLVIGFDRDPAACERARQAMDRVDSQGWEIRPSRFSEIGQNLEQLGLVGKISGIIFDLGFSSDQVSDPERGISFQHDGPLDMRMDPRLTVMAADLVNGLSESELVKLFSRLGEAQYSRRVARRIVETRKTDPVKTTVQMRTLVEKAVGGVRFKQRMNPATQFFQALRIAVNDELHEIEVGLQTAVEVLEPQGRLVVISFHSLEDRIVKNFMRTNDRLVVVTDKPIRASDDEVANNPRARSAKLRVAQII